MYPPNLKSVALLVPAIIAIIEVWRGVRTPILGYSHGRSQGLPKNFRAFIHRAHRAVIFAIAWLSCVNLLRSVS